MSLTLTPDDPASEQISDSFWEIGQYKRTVSRIDSGLRLCDDLMSFMKERANIEEQYSKLLKGWSSRYRKVIEKNSSYNTLETTWLQMLNEADRSAQLHSNIRETLMTDPYEKVKQWKKDNYHSLTLGGLKESKTANDEFMRAQKQWAKLFKKVSDTKKSYFTVCKEERSAQIAENQAKSDSTIAPDKVKKLQEHVEKKAAEKLKHRDKYETALQDLDNDQGRYMEDMESAFKKCQGFEKSRLTFFKEVFTAIHSHVDLSNVPEHKNIYRDMSQSIKAANADDDLLWWRKNHGPDMPMNWPVLEDYDPERIHMQKSLSKRQGSKVSKHVAGMDGITGSQFTSTYDNDSAAVKRTSGNGVGVNRPNSWSDDDDGNPFAADSGSDGATRDSAGVRVVALYDYVGQEDDELSFSQGEQLFKMEDEDEQGWCKGRLKTGQVGLYPANYVQLA